MDTMSTPETPSDPPPAAGPPVPLPSATPSPPSLGPRLSRVGDYLAHSLERGDVLEANLGSINSGLMTMALRVEAMITQAMDRGLTTGGQLDNLMPAIDTYTRLTRQVDRFAQFQHRLREPRRENANKTPRNPPRQEHPPA